MMKIKLIVNVVVIICVLLMAYFFIYKLTGLTQEYSSFVPYNPKINRYGEYQPFYGYTIVAMIDPSITTIAAQIEIFLRTSSLSASYSALPATTYHMTIYSIYQCGNRMVPAIKRWANATGVKISNSYWLPNEVLQDQNDKAMCVIEQYLSEPLRIKHASLNIGPRNIKLLLEVNDASMVRIRKARDEFVKIYEDLDLSMKPIDDKLHITFAYVYAPSTVKFDADEWNQLNKLVRTLVGKSFSLPSVYMFDSMTNYIPYRKYDKSKCRSITDNKIE